MGRKSLRETVLIGNRKLDKELYSICVSKDHALNESDIQLVIGTVELLRSKLNPATPMPFAIVNALKYIWNQCVLEQNVREAFDRICVTSFKVSLTGIDLRLSKHHKMHERRLRNGTKVKHKIIPKDQKVPEYVKPKKPKHIEETYRYPKFTPPTPESKQRAREWNLKCKKIHQEQNEGRLYSKDLVNSVSKDGVYRGGHDDVLVLGIALGKGLQSQYGIESYPLPAKYL